MIHQSGESLFSGAVQSVLLCGFLLAGGWSAIRGQIVPQSGQEITFG
jgi:hypothetical protein